MASRRVSGGSSWRALSSAECTTIFRFFADRRRKMGGVVSLENVFESTYMSSAAPCRRIRVGGDIVDGADSGDGRDPSRICRVF